MLSWLFSNPLPVGTPAPGFTLPDERGGSATLSSLRGQNVVLVFYPADETTVCRKQLCEFRDDWEMVKAKKTVVFGVNSGSAVSHSAFKKAHSFPFPLLVDSGQKVARLYSAHGLIIKRTVYLIGPDGVIRYAKRGKPLPEEVLAAAV